MCRPKLLRTKGSPTLPPASPSPNLKARASHLPSLQAEKGWNPERGTRASRKPLAQATLHLSRQRKSPKPPKPQRVKTICRESPPICSKNNATGHTCARWFLVQSSRHLKLCTRTSCPGADDSSKMLALWEEEVAAVEDRTLGGRGEECLLGTHLWRSLKGAGADRGHPNSLSVFMQ